MYHLPSNRKLTYNENIVVENFMSVEIWAYKTYPAKVIDFKGKNEYNERFIKYCVMV